MLKLPSICLIGLFTSCSCSCAAVCKILHDSTSHGQSVVAELLVFLAYLLYVNRLKLLLMPDSFYVDSGSNKACTERLHSWWVQMWWWNVHWTETSLWPWISLSWRHWWVWLSYVEYHYCAALQSLLNLFVAVLSSSSTVFVCIWVITFESDDFLHTYLT